MILLDVHGDSTRRTIRSEGTLVRIGRDPECEVHLPGDPTISRVHAVIRRDRGWAVADNDSRNGTIVNGERITGPTPLMPEDRIIVGDYLIRFRDETALAEPTVPIDGETVGRRVETPTGLSGREVEVLRLVCRGLSDRQIADELVLSIKTVHSHLDRIRDKTGLRRRAELVRYGLELRLV